MQTVRPGDMGVKTFKREEIYANRYEDLGHMRVNIEEFIDRNYNRQRLHSALAQLDHLRMFFGFFAILFLVKLCVSFAAVRKNG